MKILRWEYLLLLVLVVSVFFPVLSVDEFVYDSEHIIEKNSRLREAGGFSKLWTGTYWGINEPGGLYRPLTLSSYWVEINLLGFKAPWQFVLVNLFLHFLAAVLLYELGLFWLRNYWATLVGVLLFTVHPVGTSVVPNLVGRADLLTTVFFLCSLLTWEYYRESGTKGWACLTIVGWLLALLSKESSVVLPAIILAREALGSDGELRHYGLTVVGRHSWFYAGLGVAGVSWFVTRTVLLGGFAGRVLVPLQNPLAYVDATDRVLTAMKILALYGWKAIVPLNLSADYSFRAIRLVSSPLSQDFLVALLVVGFLLGLTVVLLLDRHLSALGFVLFFVALLPVSNLFVTIGTIMADRLLYLPLTGFCLSFGFLLVDQLRGTQAAASMVLIFVIAGVLGFYGARTLRRNLVWQNELTLWSQTVREVPDSVVANYLYAVKTLETRNSPGNDRLALTHARKAIRLTRDFPGPTPVGPYHSYALALMQRVKTISSEADRRTVLKKGAGVLEEARRSLEADFESGYDYRSDGPRPERFRLLYHDLGSLQLELGQLRRAEENLRKALKFDSSASDWALLGKVKLRQGERKKGLRYLKRAVEMAPDQPNFRTWLEDAR